MMRRSLLAVLVACLTEVIAAHPAATQQGGGIFSPEVWWSSSEYWTWSVALGDIDGDGDLDLVCGNSDDWTGQPNTLYLNDAGVLSATPAWQSDAANMTLSVALGDIDGDGDLDLACGNAGNDGLPERNEVYTNIGGTFGATPSWTADSLAATTGIALADMDNDGDLDLVCGSYKTGTVMYRNEAGTLSRAPSWRSGVTEPTFSIAVGDVNADGYLDLVCGNDGSPNSLYLNAGGTFNPTPDWYADSTYSTTSVVLGDVNGDGLMDLACSNGVNEFVGESYALHLNQGGVLAKSPSWTCASTNALWDIDLGDVDNDGDLDLVGRTRTLMIFLNEGGMFPAAPSDSLATGVPSSMSGMCLGDVNLDGRLDLVSGTVVGATLHQNICPPFSTTPDRRWGQYWGSTRRALLRDVDGDEDLDLVEGGFNGRPGLYWNRAGVLDTIPAWTLGDDADIWGIDLADIDGDGKLDLATADYRSASCYPFAGDVFAGSPAWRLDTEAIFTSVAFGDIDGDRDPDLVVGMTDGAGSELYMNDNDTLAAVPAWVSNPPNRWLHYTQAVALGDVNGDRKPDLVCANVGEEGVGNNTLYLNQGGVFSDAPDWTSGGLTAANDVALGDIDGDGLLDAVFGNLGLNLTGERNTMFLNRGGTFARTPDWSSSASDPTFGIDLGDIDGDGDLDLICANAGSWWGSGESSVIYQNDAGALTTDPTWAAPPDYMTSCVASGDIDQDGDMDIVFGGASAEPTSLPVKEYFGRANPAFKGNPVAPRNQLPDNAAFVRSVSVQKTGQNNYRIRAVVVDVESDPVWLMFDYQYKGQPVWHPATIAGHGSRVGPLDATPAGASYERQWDVSTLPFDDRDVVLRVRTVSNPGRVSIVQRVPVYHREMGPIEPARPEIAPSASVISFPVITVGDSVASSVTLTNAGNLTLSIAAVTLPSTELRCDQTAPLDIAPGGSVTFRLLLEPREETAISGFLSIQSNDPITPLCTIGVETDIRALQVTTNLLKSTPEIPLGEAVTVVVSPFPLVHIESGFLLLRPAGSEAFLDSIPLSVFAEDFIAVIPGEKVSEAGLEYYVRVENSGVLETDPPGAPVSYFTQAVRSPQSISSIPRVNSNLGFMEASPIFVDVSLEQGTALTEGFIHFRRGGEPAYTTAGPVSLDPTLVFALPDSVVGARGVEYWIETRTLTRTLTDPAHAPGSSPHTIAVSVRNLQEDRKWPGETYRMVSIPLAVIDAGQITLEALLSDQVAFGPYDPGQWRCFRYASDAGRYVELSDKGAADHFRPTAGASFWLASREANRVNTAPTIGHSTPTNSPYAIALAPGWNMIGNPFDFPVSWDSMTVDGHPMTEAEQTVVSPPVGWSGSEYQYDLATLDPWKGCWVKNLAATTVTLRVPPVEADDAAAAPAGPDGAKAEESGAGWVMAIVAASQGARDEYNVCGAKDDARDEWDRFDRAEAPMSPGEGISLYFTHGEWDTQRDRYAVDLRADGAGGVGGARGHSWSFDVAKNFSRDAAGDEVIMRFSGTENVPADARILLVDRTLNRFVDLREEARYTYFQGRRAFVASEKAARFVLLVGDDDFIGSSGHMLPGPPARTALHQNHPNPFNPSTVIRYDLARPGKARLVVYDVRGALVKVLEDRDREAGRYEIGWNGDDQRGNRVASGIYFYQLVTSGFSETRKMVLLK